MTQPNSAPPVNTLAEALARFSSVAPAGTREPVLRLAECMFYAGAHTFLSLLVRHTQANDTAAGRALMNETFAAYERMHQEILGRPPGTPAPAGPKVVDLTVVSGMSAAASADAITIVGPMSGDEMTKFLEEHFSVPQDDAGEAGQDV